MYPTKNINNLVNVIDYEKLIKQQANSNRENKNRENETCKQKVLIKGNKISYHQK